MINAQKKNDQISCYLLFEDLALSAGFVEYTDCTSAEGKDLPLRVS